MAFTEEQVRAIEAQGRVIVSASAGSGKTTVMIKKIIDLVQLGVGVDEILAVTFTKKASMQMKEKLSKALIEAINAEDADEERRKRLKNQLAEVGNADISTIHSFCAKLLRRYFYAVGVDSSFRVIGSDDAEGTALKNEALDELLEDAYEKKEEKFSLLLSSYWRKKSDNALRKIFTETYETLRQRADYKEYLKGCSAYDENTFDNICKDLHSDFCEKCRYYAEEVRKEEMYFAGEDICGRERIGYSKAQYEIATLLYDWLMQMASAPDYFALASIPKPKLPQNRKDKKKVLETEQDWLAHNDWLWHIDRLGFLKDRVGKFVEDEIYELLSREEELQAFLRSGELADALATYLLIYDKKYEDLKKERGVLDYNDLEHKSLELLSKEEIANEVRQKYRYVFVDEYQDVNPVQEELVNRIGGDNLFLVGDVKQAIYGFRGSKSKFFVEKQTEFEKTGGKNLKMTYNFRSADEVLDAVNAQFSLSMTKRVCSVDYKDDSYMEKGGRYEKNSGRVRVHFVAEEEKEKQERGVYSVREKTEKGEISTSQLAKKIREIIERETRLEFYDADEGRMRLARYSDIAILSRKKKGKIAKTVASLSALGIPVTSASAVNICEYSEIKTLIDILSIIDNFEQDVPLASALLSPMGNLTADELVNIRLAYPSEHFFRVACQKYAEEEKDFTAHKLRAFYAYYEKVRSLSCLLSAGELLTRILTETRMESLLLSRKNGQACLKRIHRFLEESEVGESLCIHDFLDRLRDLDYKIEYNENGGEDSVKVLTMHSSKGLEYPIVILDDMSANFRTSDRDEVYVEEKYGLAPRSFDGKKMTKNATVLRRLHEVRTAESARGDELNLYYVAMTRAKYALHIIFESKSATTDFKYARSFAEFTDFSVWEKYFHTDPMFDIPTQEGEAMVFRPDSVLTQAIMRAFTWQYPYAGYENLPVKSSATGLIKAQEQSGFDEVAKVGYGRQELTVDEQYEQADEENQGQSADSKELGIAYHAFLENFDFSTLYDENGVPVSEDILYSLIQDTLQKMQKTQGERASLLDEERLKKILRNPVFYELRGSVLYKEQQFLASLPVKETYGKEGYGADNPLLDGEEMIFQGAIDLLAVGEEVRIIDYKYSAQNAEYLLRHYRPQLELYRLAVSKITGVAKEKIRCTIVNIRLGFQVDMQ